MVEDLSILTSSHFILYVVIGWLCYVILYLVYDSVFILTNYSYIINK